MTLTTAVGCSQDKADDKPAEGIVLDLGGEIVALNDLDAQPEVVGHRPEGTEAMDTYRLTSPRQLKNGDIVGIRDGGAVSISPTEPGKATLLTKATAWFPSIDADKIWAVTEESATASCSSQEARTTVRARYTIVEQQTSGHPARGTLLLPCGVTPVAQTTAGIVALQALGDDAGADGRVRTSVVLLDKQGAVATVVAKHADVLAAGANRIVWRTEDCETATTCTKIYDVEAKKSENAPSCGTSDTAGTGMLSADGRWYATALNSGAGNHAVVLDLEGRSCRDLGEFPALAQSVDLNQDLAATWAGGNLLLLDQQSGELVEHNAPTARTTKRRQALPVTNGGQIWGAGKAG